MYDFKKVSILKEEPITYSNKTTTNKIRGVKGMEGLKGLEILSVSRDYKLTDLSMITVILLGLLILIISAIICTYFSINEYLFIPATVFIVGIVISIFDNFLPKKQPFFREEKIIKAAQTNEEYYIDLDKYKIIDKDGKLITLKIK